MITKVELCEILNNERPGDDQYWIREAVVDAGSITTVRVMTALMKGSRTIIQSYMDYDKEDYYNPTGKYRENMIVEKATEEHWKGFVWQILRAGISSFEHKAQVKTTKL